MNPVQGLVQDIGHLLQDVDKLLQDISSGKLADLLNKAGDQQGSGRCHGHHGSQGSDSTGGTDSSNGCHNHGGLSGEGSITGDPHFVGADGEKYDVQGEAGKTYNLLSDTGIQVNGKFQQWGNSNATTVGEMGITMGGDRIDIAKDGTLTINGKKVGDGSYLNGAVEKHGNKITVKNDHYTLDITSQNGQYLDTHLKATDAGLRRDPGGLWGQSLMPGDKIDTKAQDFEVDSLFARPNGGNGHHDHGAGGLDSIRTDFTPPTLQGDSIQDALNFEKAIMQFATQVSSATTALNTLGNALKDSVSKMAQG